MDNKSISVKAGLLDGSATGPVIYEETHSVTTNDIGLFSIKIGNGTVVTGDFSIISWGTSLKYLDISMDVNGGSNYQNVGTVQLLSVPYALYAEESGGDADSDPTN